MGVFLPDGRRRRSHGSTFALISDPRIVKIVLFNSITILGGEAMTNTISASLGLFVLAFFMLDFGFSNSENALFLAQKFVIVLDEMAIWR
jgi:hypothetical protein